MELVKVTCPACGRVLINPVAGADGQVRCSNCGQRFDVAPQTSRPESGEAEPVAPTPHAAADLVEPAPSAEPVTEGRVAAGSVPSGRPPQPASYGATTLLAHLLLFVSSFGSLLMLVFAVPEFLRYYFALWLILLAALVGSMADRCETAARAMAGEAESGGCRR